MCTLVGFYLLARPYTTPMLLLDTPYREQDIGTNR